MTTYSITQNGYYRVHQFVGGQEVVNEIYPKVFKHYSEARTFALDRVNQDETRVKVQWNQK